MKTWKEFCRYHGSPDFYGCVNAEGEWFDSSESFDIAVQRCCYSAGAFDLTNEGEVQWMATEGRKRGYSIIHSTMLEQMYEKGLIK
jgi:hypothetical protein